MAGDIPLLISAERPEGLQPLLASFQSLLAIDPLLAQIPLVYCRPFEEPSSHSFFRPLCLSQDRRHLYLRAQVRGESQIDQ